MKNHAEKNAGKKQGEITPGVYSVIPLDFIYSDSKFSKNSELKKLNFRVAGGETATFTFAVTAGLQDLRDVKIRIDDLLGPNGEVIKGSNFDVRIVKVWNQSALHWEVARPDEGIFVPETLMRDDRIIIDEQRDDTGRYLPPQILNVEFGTNIPASTVKQVWVNAEIPLGIKSGVYQGKMIISATNLQDGISIPMNIEILPFDLPAPRHLYGLYYRFTISGSNPKMQRSRDLILKDLLAIKRVGIEAITIYSIKDIEAFVELLLEAGMRGPLVVMGGRNIEEIHLVNRICHAKGIEVYFYGIDEPNNEKKKEEHVFLSKMLHQAEGRVMTAITVNSALSLIEQGEGLDWANLNFDRETVEFYKNNSDGRGKWSGKLLTYYWQVYQENPTRNRLLAGFYLWRSGADGVFPYEYQGFPDGLPWSEDTRMSNHNVKEKGKMRTFRMWCLTYPSQEGPVSTLQWEGFRSGITDMRYLTLLENLQKSLLEKGQIKAFEGIQEKFNEIINEITILPNDLSVYTNPYISPQKLQDSREKIIDLILAVLRKN